MLLATATAQFVVLGDRDVISRIHRNQEQVGAVRRAVDAAACLLSHC